MSIEERLTEALRAEADRLDGDPGQDRAAWGEIQAAADARQRRRRVQRFVGRGLAVAAAIVLVLGLVATLSGDGGQRLQTGPAGSGDAEPAPTTTAAPDSAVPTTAAPAPQPAPGQDVLIGIWPYATQAEAPRAEPAAGTPGSAPEPTAVGFATRYLGMPAPEVVPGRGSGGAGASTAEVVIRPKPRSPMLTSVHLRKVGSAWTVTAARAANIRLEQPAEKAAIGSTVTVAGTSTAFEATVQVEVRQAGQLFGKRLGSSFVMGGANGEMGAFAGDVTIDPPTRTVGAVVLFTDSAEDGSVQEATVVPVTFVEGARSGGGLTRFSVFFHRGESLVEVGRETGQTKGVLRAALESLFAGPQSEDGPGLSSLFSAKTADLLAGVTLRPDGTAVIDLARTVNNASTSAGSQALLEEMNATAFQFSTVERIEYRLAGSCQGFWQWLQRAGCPLVKRP